MTMVDCLTPTFLVTIGTIFLCLALLVVYFESKSREQNHKINSMLSLVSTLADELNNYKIGLNNLTMMVGGGRPMHDKQNFNDRDFGKLIHVSDDEPLENDDDDDEDSDDDEDGDEDNEDNEEDEDDEDDEDEEDDDDDEEDGSKESDDDKSDNDVNEIEMIDLENTAEFNTESNITNPFILKDEIKKVDLECLPTIEIVGVSKKIHLSLEDNVMVESLDLKKLPVAKLRELASVKNVSDDVNKLKKSELIELLEQNH